MIPVNELKNKNIQIFLGLPMYGCMLSEVTFHGILQLQAWAAHHQIKLRIQTMGNESLVCRARNTLVGMMMDQKEFIATHMLFIDADIGFQPQNIERLVCADKDVVCGIYPRKCHHWDQVIDAVKQNPNISEEEVHAKSLGFNINIDNADEVSVQHGYCKVNEAATGMMLVKRQVFKKMMKAFPERKYNSDQIINGNPYRSENAYNLFDVGIYGKHKRYLSEDYYFSRLWQELDGEIWADITLPLSHFGATTFTGSVGSLFQRKKK